MMIVLYIAWLVPMSLGMGLMGALVVWLIKGALGYET